MLVFTTESTMEFDSREDFEKVLALMPWTPEQKKQLLDSGELVEEDEAEFDGIGVVDSTHKFTLTEK